MICIIKPICYKDLSSCPAGSPRHRAIDVSMYLWIYVSMYPCIHVSIYLCLYVSKMLQNSFENGPKFVKNGPKSMENGPKFIKNQPNSIPEVTLAPLGAPCVDFGPPCVDFGPFRREMAHPWPSPCCRTTDAGPCLSPVSYTHLTLPTKA